MEGQGSDTTLLDTWTIHVDSEGYEPLLIRFNERLKENGSVTVTLMRYEVGPEVMVTRRVEK